MFAEVTPRSRILSFCIGWGHPQPEDEDEEEATGNTGAKFPTPESYTLLSGDLNVGVIRVCHSNEKPCWIRRPNGMIFGRPFTTSASAKMACNELVAVTTS